MNPIEFLGKIVEISHSNLELSSRLSSILNFISQDMRYEEAIVYTLDKDKWIAWRCDKISDLFRDQIGLCENLELKDEPYFDRIWSRMDIGNRLRDVTKHEAATDGRIPVAGLPLGCVFRWFTGWCGHFSHTKTSV